jgi:hypothetical protein
MPVNGVRNSVRSRNAKRKCVIGNAREEPGVSPYQGPSVSVSFVRAKKEQPLKGLEQPSPTLLLFGTLQFRFNRVWFPFSPSAFLFRSSRRAFRVKQESKRLKRSMRSTDLLILASVLQEAPPS